MNNADFERSPSLSPRASVQFDGDPAEPNSHAKLEHQMHLASTLGFIAGTLTTISFVPQVFKAWRSKRCHDLSWGMLITFSAGVTLWLAYGLMLWAAPIILANAVTLTLLVAIALLKAKYRSAESVAE
jgi:MtN3 and saliva related transmembrane protein